ncbi:hypothetical protein H2200_011463 [Cladophialophora chaetospira]|uniref:BTB domain-containing protein n=1 Tax=Cladophialophora chaetospira TaxID=386627 RepID=A0AA38WZC3_9EURO|nr:hypothetical protein H2200_011463 [Cladophialophora chaetospira]
MDLPPPTYESFIHSHEFEFLVGPDKKPFYIHADLPGIRSEYFGKLISGKMLEAQERTATLKDIDEGTFLRFTEFVYRGDYTTPAPKRIPDPEIPLPNEKAADNKAMQVPMAAENETAAPAQPLSDGTVAVNEDPDDDYTAVFLAHANLYIFSDQCFIESLKALVVQKLCLALSRFILHDQRVEDIVELLRHTYNHTVSPENGIDPLRDLLTEYVGCVADKVCEHEAFKALMEENAEIMKDLLPRLLERFVG